MLSCIEVRNYRCLAYIRQELQPFQVLVGPNGSGKTTLLDSIAWLSDVVSSDLDSAFFKRCEDHDFSSLLSHRQGTGFEIAVEAVIPEHIRSQLGQHYDTLRYEIGITWNDKDGQPEFSDEQVWIFTAESKNAPRQLTLFPSLHPSPETIIRQGKQQGWRRIVRKVPGGNDNFYSETSKESGRSDFNPSYRLGPRRSALANMPEDETRYPATAWFRRLLTSGSQPLMLNSLSMRRASPPRNKLGFEPSGSNLPWAIEQLTKSSHERWIAHIRTAIPDIEDITTVERPDDKHRYLQIHYSGGLKIPSWLASDGTLRLIALTLPAYLPNLDGWLYTIEEPENGIHPQAIETVIQSLSSVYACQVLVATHSPVILGVTDPKQVLCFAKTQSGITDIVAGNDHPALANWHGMPNLSVLYAAGVLS